MSGILREQSGTPRQCTFGSLKMFSRTKPLRPVDQNWILNGQSTVFHYVFIAHAIVFRSRCNLSYFRRLLLLIQTAQNVFTHIKITVSEWQQIGNETNTFCLYTIYSKKANMFKQLRHVDGPCRDGDVGWSTIDNSYYDVKMWNKQ